jgi:hypothetical protein
LILSKFIEDVFVKEFDQIIKAGHAYIAFGLICQALESLGALMDNNALDSQKRGISSERLFLALKFLGNEKYHQPSNLVELRHSNQQRIKDLRNGLLHFYSPKKGVILCERIIDSEKFNHLEITTGNQLPLFIEDFFDDFKGLALRVVSSIRNGTFQFEFADNWESGTDEDFMKKKLMIIEDSDFIVTDYSES